MIKTNKKPSSLWIICVLIFCLINHYATYQITSFDGRGYFIILISIVLLYIRRKSFPIKPFYTNTAVIVWGVLMTYHIINTYIFYGITEELLSQNIISCTIESILLMTLCAYLYCEDKVKLYWTLITAFFYYLLIAYNFNEMHESGRLSGFLYTTQLGQLSGITCLVISMLIYSTKKYTYSVLYIFPVFMMFLAGSRNGLAVVFLALVALAIPFLVKDRRVLILVLFLGVILVNYLQDSLVWERRDDQNLMLIETGTIFDTLLGDRIFYYVVGWQNFLDNPINGIGLLNFMNYNQYDYPLHTEPMTHLVEGGLIGASLYVYFYWYFIKNLIRQFNLKNGYMLQCMIAFCAISIVGVTARIFHYSFFFTIYGIIIGEFYSNNRKQHII